MTPRSATRPEIGDFQIAVAIRSPRHSTSRTAPTLTEVTRAVLAGIGVVSPQKYDSPHFTLIEYDPLPPPIRIVKAVIVTLPFRFPVTRPLEDTDATIGLELDQKKV